jgi:hypothetical protein
VESFRQEQLHNSQVLARFLSIESPQLKVDGFDLRLGRVVLQLQIEI